MASLQLLRLLTPILCYHNGLVGKESACSGGDQSSVLGLGRSPGEGNNYPLQYSCLGNSMHRGASWATVHGVAKSQTQLSNFYFSHPIHSSQTFKLPTQHNLANLQLFASYLLQLGFPRGSAGKESACNVGDLGSIPGFRRSPGEGKGYPLHYSGLKSSMDCTAHGVAKSQTPLSDFYFHFCFNYWFCIFTLPLLIHGNHFDSHPALSDKQVFSLTHSTDGILLHRSLPEMVHMKFIISFVS